MHVELLWPSGADEALRAGVNLMVRAVTEDGGAIGYVTPPGREETDRWLDGVLAGVREGDAAFAVALAEGEVAGCALWLRRTTVETYRHGAELRQVMTHPRVRGRGLGRLLVSGVVDHARGAGLELLTLGVRGDNHRAIALYERLGFREWGRLPYGIAVGEERFDDVKMYLDLTPGGAG